MEGQADTGGGGGQGDDGRTKGQADAGVVVAEQMMEGWKDRWMQGVMEAEQMTDGPKDRRTRGGVGGRADDGRTEGQVQAVERGSRVSDVGGAVAWEDARCGGGGGPRLHASNQCDLLPGVFVLGQRRLWGFLPKSWDCPQKRDLWHFPQSG